MTNLEKEILIEGLQKRLTEKDNIIASHSAERNDIVSLIHKYKPTNAEKLSQLSQTFTPGVKKRIGRPLGTKNKPKTAIVKVFATKKERAIGLTNAMATYMGTRREEWLSANQISEGLMNKYPSKTKSQLQSSVSSLAHGECVGTHARFQRMVAEGEGFYRYKLLY